MTLDLKRPRPVINCISSGSEVHNFVAPTANARFPQRLHLDLGTSRHHWPEELKRLSQFYIVKRSVKEVGESPFNVLKTNNKMLKSILKCTGSQGRERRTGVMASYAIRNLLLWKLSHVTCTSFLLGRNISFSTIRLKKLLG